MTEKISANGIDDVRDVKTMMHHEFKDTDDEHGLMGSKEVFVHSVHMWDARSAAEIQYLACYSWLVFVEPLLLTARDSPKPNPKSILSFTLNLLYAHPPILAPNSFTRPRTAPLSPRSPVTKFRNTAFVLSHAVSLPCFVMIIRTRTNRKRATTDKKSPRGPRPCIPGS